MPALSDRQSICLKGKYMLPIIPQTPIQFELRNALQDVLPTDLIHLVDGYLTHSGATEVLELGSDGKPVDSEFNRQTIDAMKLALSKKTSDRGMIRLIFQNANSHGYTSHLNAVMNEMRAQKLEIILDHVDFSGLDLSFLVFDTASMKQANFSESNLHATNFFGSDLTDAKGLQSTSGIFVFNNRTIVTDTPMQAVSARMFTMREDGAVRFSFKQSD
jgi:hypothetical protein